MKIRGAIWWALLNHPSDLPVLFADRRQAQENCEPDEYMVRVIVQAAHPKQRKAPPRSGARRASNRMWFERRRLKELCAKCGKPNPRFPKWNCAPCSRMENTRKRRGVKYHPHVSSVDAQA